MNQGRGAAAVLERQLCPSRAVLPAQHSVCHFGHLQVQVFIFYSSFGVESCNHSKESRTQGMEGGWCRAQCPGPCSFPVPCSPFQTPGGV